MQAVLKETLMAAVKDALRVEHSAVYLAVL